MGIERVAGRGEPLRRRGEVPRREMLLSAGQREVAAHFLEGGVPCGQAHDDVGEILDRGLVRRREVEPSGARRSDCRRHRERDAAPGAGLEVATHRLLGILERGERGLWVLGKGDAGAVDAIEEVMATRQPC